MADFQVYDNFLEQSYFNEIEKLITMHELPWYTSLGVGSDDVFGFWPPGLTTSRCCRAKLGPGSRVP